MLKKLLGLSRRDAGKDDDSAGPLRLSPHLRALFEEMIEGKTRLRSYSAILELSRSAQASIVLEALENVGRSWRLERDFQAKSAAWFRAVLLKLASQLLRRKLSWTAEQAARLATLAAEDWRISTAGVVRALEDFIQQHGLQEPLPGAVKQLRQSLHSSRSSDQRLIKRLEALLEGGKAPKKDIRSLFQGQDAWSRTLLNTLAQRSDAESWGMLLEYCDTARGSKPAEKWLRRAAELIAPLGEEHFAEVVIPVLGEIGKPGAVVRHTQWDQTPDPTLLDDRDTDLLRGLVWSTTRLPHAELVTAVGRAAEMCFCKVPGHGPRNVKVGNACLQALSRRDDLVAVAELSRLRTKVKHPSIRRQLEKALERAARRLEMDPAELEEMATPDFGLQEVGRRRDVVGDFTAEIAVETGGEVVLRWIKADGKLQKSVPKNVRDEHPEALKALRKTVQEIRKARPALVARLERLYLHPREWDVSAWRERYADHPLMATLARRLVWRLVPRAGGDGELVFFDGGGWVSVGGRAAELAEGSRVRLWHPIESPPETVRAWRLFLEERGLTQPFKQAHREIYVLTDAERRAVTYSNRFAAHILRQHQLAALAQARGWRYQLMGDFDSYNVPTLELPQHGLRVEFWLDPGHEDDKSEMGIFLHVATDQVRFAGVDEARRLETIPPIVFSEVLRDVDLFVGVTSVGNDPAWRDRGEAPYYDYWENYSFGELGTMATNRRETLERLVPRLKISPRCSLTERFLVVRGELRTYKIHLGSGNILMSPNDEYLCIVADRWHGGSRPVLPFEGDRMLSVILSKAFLLADDKKIKDRTILSQIRRS